MAKRPAAAKTAKPAASSPAAPATSKDTQPDGTPMGTLLAWSSARDALRLAARAAAAAQEALVKLPEEASEEERAKARDLVLSAQEAVFDVIGAIDKLPDLPFSALLFGNDETTEPSTEAPAGEPIILGVDKGADPESLVAIKVKGPRDGRWRLAHKFTGEEQRLLASPDTLARLKDDPLLTVTAAD